MGFDKRQKAKQYTLSDGDSLKAIADRETASGNELTWQDLAKFNWGTGDEQVANEFMRDELGARKRDDANNFVISADDEPRGEPLLIPVKFQRKGLSLEKTHTLKVRKKKADPQFLDCCEIAGVTFAFDKSFVRPSVVDHIKKLEQAVTKHPEAKILIFGHTDKVGGLGYNKNLSERRALSTYAFITNDAGVWESLYTDEEWGVRAIQEILKDLGGSYDPGPADGIQGPKTNAAIRKYQEDRGLTVDAIAGPKTREQLFTDYMAGKHDLKLTAGQFMDPKHMGCGEFNPVSDTQSAHEPNRRVVFYLFNPSRLPKLPCNHEDMAPCKKQITPPSPRHIATFKCSFYDSLSKDCGCEGGTPPKPPKPVPPKPVPPKPVPPKPVPPKPPVVPKDPSCGVADTDIKCGHGRVTLWKLGVVPDSPFGSDKITITAKIAKTCGKHPEWRLDGGSPKVAKTLTFDAMAPTTSKLWIPTFKPKTYNVKLQEHLTHSYFVVDAYPSNQLSMTLDGKKFLSALRKIMNAAEWALDKVADKFEWKYLEGKASVEAAWKEHKNGIAFYAYNIVIKFDPLVGAEFTLTVGPSKITNWIKKLPWIGKYAAKVIKFIIRAGLKIIFSGGIGCDVGYKRQDPYNPTFTKNLGSGVEGKIELKLALGAGALGSKDNPLIDVELAAGGGIVGKGDGALDNKGFGVQFSVEFTGLKGTLKISLLWGILPDVEEQVTLISPPKEPIWKADKPIYLYEN